MDHKTWLWKKKSSEKVILAFDHNNVNPSFKEQEQEIHNLRSEKTELENEVKFLNDKLSSALRECNNKEEQAKNNANMAHDANAGWEKAKTELASSRQELDTALQQRLVGDDRISQLDAALKECMQQLRFVRDEQEKRIHGAITNATKEFEKSKTIFEENLAEKSKILAKFRDENTLLSKALLAKEISVEDLSKQKSKLEENLTTLASRLEFSEKDNASLKYEVRLLEKEVEIWNEEREFSRRSSDASHKQHLENAKKIAKLESECQRLRILVRKRLPGPAALAKMKDEVDILDTRRRRSSSSPDRLPDTSTANNVNFLTEQLCGLAEENKNLKEALSKKINELQFSRNLYSCAASKVSEIESQVEESPKNVKRELFVSSMSDTGSDEKAESRASVLISKLENLKSGNLLSPSRETTRVSDISLMDDFLEMEKIAIVSEENSCESVAFSVSGPSESGSSGNFSDGKGTEIVPLVENDVLVPADAENNGLVSADAAKLEDNSMESDTLPEVTNFETENSFSSDLRKSVCKIIELIEGISYENSEPCRVFQWKASELGPVSQQVKQTCYDLINGKADMNQFTEEISSALEWIVSHFQDETRTERENEQLKCDLINLEAKRRELEESLQSAVDKSEHLSNQLEDSEKTVARLLKELETSKENNGVLVEDQDKSRIEDIEAQLSVALADLNEACQKLSSVEAELENKSSCYEKLEAKCLDLQLQLESLTNRETSSEHKQEENPVRSDLEINAASEKLAECQETILNLGKQLKALASPRDASLFDKVAFNPTTPTNTTIVTPGSPKSKLTHLGSSLLYQMIADDDEKAKENDSISSSGFVVNGAKHSEKDVAVNSLAIVPRKKAKNASLWRKLLSRKRKSVSSKTTLTFKK